MVSLIGPPFLGAIIVLLAAAWTTGSTTRRRSGVALGLTAVLPQWLMPAEPALLRGASALVACVGCMRVIDLYRGQWALGGRLLHVLSIVDTRRLARTERRLPVEALVETLAWGLVAGAAYGALFLPLPHARLLSWATRWALGLVVAYAGVSAGYRLADVVYAALGFRTPPTHLAPALSRSVQELWGQRWARPISTWLGETFFLPYARRRRPVMGAFLAFVVSAAFHAYAVWIALGLVRGLPMAASMFAYFVAQAGVMGTERVLGVRTWRGWAGRTWTVCWMLATSPLFLEPAVRTLGVPSP
jgi:hypothetical protein